MNVKMVKIDVVSPYEDNPRTISGTAVERVAKSIKDFGFRQPIVVDANNVIIVGHTRYRAAVSLGMEEVPIHVADMTDDQVRAYRIADNKTGELSSWDNVLLKKELELLQALEDVDMDSTAFTQKELLKALAPPDSDVTGSTELNGGDFQDFEHKCPRCGFEYNKDAKSDKD